MGVCGGFTKKPTTSRRFRQSKLTSDRSLDRSEVRQFFRSGSLLRVLHHTILADDESRPGRGIAHAGEHREQDTIVLHRLLVESREQGHRNFVLLGPGLMRER